jgi:hypothetical protein
MLGLAEAQGMAVAGARALIATQMGINVAMFAGSMLLNSSNDAYRALGVIMLFAAGAAAALAIARAAVAPELSGLQVAAAIAVGGAISAGAGLAISGAMEPPELNIPMADTGLSGLGGRHFPIMVEPGESVVSKTQNMLGGGGITLNIAGDIVTSDADDFAERIATALPEALRRQNEIGGI